ncbi:MAG: iron-sulfur cluster assembly scaffold protein [Bryobacteraceae bacterium]
MIGLVYSDILLDHFKNPRNVGELPPPAVTVEVENPACGDILRLSVLLDNGAVSAARYKVRGCTASIAAASALTEWMEGKTPGDLAMLNPAAIERAVGGLIPESKHAAVLCVDGVKAFVARVSDPRDPNRK